MQNKYTVKIDDTTQIVELWRAGILISSFGYKDFMSMFETLQPAYSFVVNTHYFTPEEYKKWEDAENW